MKTPVCRTLVLFLGVSMTVALSSAQELDRSRRPGAGPVPTITLPAIQKASLKNGLAVWLVEQHKLPSVAFSLVLQSGADQDPAGKPGLATMTAELMDAGTKDRDLLQIAEELEYLGASMSFRAGTDASFGNLVTLTKHLDRSLALFADVLVHPVFPQREFDRIRKQRLTALLQQKDRAAAIATISFMRVVYGTDHPYGNDASGTEASLNALTRDDLAAFYASFYRPANATLIIVGDATMKDILPRLEGALASWEPVPVHVRPTPPAPAAGPRKVYLIDKPGAPQSEIRIGYPALSRATQEFFPVTVMNRILGGQFSSRINMNLREKRGYTYGARSAFMFLKQAGPFMASGGFTTAKTDSAVEQFLYELDRMHREGITAEELEFSKKGLTGGFALTFETNAQIAGALQNLVVYGLPDNYYENYLKSIASVSLEDVRRAAAKTLDPATMAVLIVGDLKTIRAGVEKLNLGPLVQMDTEGKPVPAK
jgi:zinc protease